MTRRSSAGARARSSLSACLALVLAMLLPVLAPASVDNGLLDSPSLAGMPSLDDEQMREVSGQALFVANKIVGANTLATGTTGFTFYRAGLDATLDMNMNIDLLELGRTSGTPGTVGGVDILAEDVAFGCVANASNTCVDSTSGTGTQLRPVRLLRPYLEFAVTNDGTRAREIAGVRLGAENISGPLSFGMMRVFSGYLTATAQLTMLGMNDVAATCGAQDLTVAGNTNTPAGNCAWGTWTTGGGYGGLGGSGANAYSGTEACFNGGCNFDGNNYMTVTPYNTAPGNQYSVQYVLSPGYSGTRGSLGLKNSEVCSLSFCAQLAATTVNFNSASSPVLQAAGNGMRLTYANVLNPGLATLIDNAVSTLTINQCSTAYASAIACAAGDWFPALLRGPAAANFKQQVAAGLGIPNNDTALNTTPLKYNLTNFHQVMVNSNNLGLSFQKQNVRYPGYALATGSGTGLVAEAIMQPGWTFYLPDAFFLQVSEPAAVFTINIGYGYAAAGNLVGLPPVYDNCWGAATFC